MQEIETGVFKIINNNPIYIIGDIHGDYQCLIHCLVDLCKVTYIESIKLDEEFNEENREYMEWNKNNNSIVVFCGDLIHRKRFEDTVLDDECSDIFIIKTLLRLKKSAIKNNGNIIIISGNHEIMNIVDPSDNLYTSDKNIEFNLKYFNDKNFINNYIKNTYAWIKINDILIAHGGLCSDYLKFLDKENNISKIQNNVVKFINDKYHDFFTNYNKEKIHTDNIGFKLFIEYDFKNKHTHNIFWCREWGYSGINCDDFNKIIKKVNCNKMIIAHCPQFLANDKPKMINFECVYNSDNTINNNIQKYKIARVDLGMSRSFEYNKQDDFFKFLFYNYNRKMSVLKLSHDLTTNDYYFNYDSIITNKISCIQYLLIKYGINKQNWIEKKINSNWLGFSYIDEILSNINNKNKNKKILKSIKCDSINNSDNIILCLLYPIFYSNYKLDSVLQYTKLLNN